MVKEDETQKILDAYVTATHLGANVYHVFFKTASVSVDTTLWQCSKIFRNREGSDFEFKVNCPELHISWCWIIFEASHAFPHTFGADHNIFQAEETLVATYSTSDMDDHVCTKRDVSSDTSPHRSKIPRIHSGKFPPKLLAEQRSNFREVFLSQ